MLSNICFCQGTCVCVCRVWLLFCSVWILSVPSGLRATNPSQVNTAAKSIHCARFVPPRLLPLVSPYHHLDCRFSSVVPHEGFSAAQPVRWIKCIPPASERDLGDTTIPSTWWSARHGTILPQVERTRSTVTFASRSTALVWDSREHLKHCKFNYRDHWSAGARTVAPVPVPFRPCFPVRGKGGKKRRAALPGTEPESLRVLAKRALLWWWG